MKEDMLTVKAQMGQLMEIVQAIVRGQEEVQDAHLRVATANSAVTLPMNPLGGTSTHVVAQPPHEGGPLYQNVAHMFNIPVSGKAQPEIDDHQDAFFTTRSNSIYDSFGSSTIEI